MRLPIGILAYYVRRSSDQQAKILGLWYYQETNVPSTEEEKKVSVFALKQKKCTALTLKGTFSQISDILAQSDCFKESGPDVAAEYRQLINDIENTPKNAPFIFDDITNVQGTAWTIYTTVDVDETFEEIMESIDKKNAVVVNISEG